jgi:hypothetical protein
MTAGEAMPRISRILSAVCIGLAFGAVAGDAAIAKPQHGRWSGEVIRAWNEIARSQPFGNPIRFSRVLAIMHAAQHDAVNGAEPRYETYASRLSDPSADAEAAAAATAHTVLVSFFPANQGSLDAELAESLASVPDGPDESTGVALGQAVGRLLLDLREDDGFDIADPFTRHRARGSGSQPLPRWRRCSKPSTRTSPRSRSATAASSCPTRRLT